jgi:pyrimidine-nucleoside phosphorylase
MRPYDIIYKKREGEVLSTEEIEFLIEGFTQGEIPDYQMSAWAMAVFFQGMNSKETADLTMAMVASGERLDLSSISGVKVDKHSTGGVGDTTTLVLGPLVAAAGVPVAKLSGRGLGHTGGTIDKLESIPGFRTDLSMEGFVRNVNKIGLAVAGQTRKLTPADKKLYALRDVTATVESIPLIASSIMSKKIAGGADGIVLDVKTGDGAFMNQIENSRKLAQAMVAIGKEIGKETIAVISDMNQPLGRAIGNALEVKEAIQTLQGKGSPELLELCLTIGSNMLMIAGKVKDFEEGYGLLKEQLNSGKALQKFKEFVGAQGGNQFVVEDLSILPQAEIQVEVQAGTDGYISNIKTRELGLVAMAIGAGRATKKDIIDPAVGVVINKRRGDKVLKGDTLAVLHLNKTTYQKEAITRLKKAFEVSNSRPEDLPLIYETIR